MPSSRQERAAFTLVELLAVLVVLGILAGMVTVALASVKESARASKTRGIIAAIDEVLRGKLEEYRVRPFSVVPTSEPFSGAPQVTPRLSPQESARARLIMVRDIMRMQLPDRATDILTGPVQIKTRYRAADNPANVDFKFVTWTQPALHQSFFERRSPNWTAQYESAECLYLILSTTFQNGINGLEMIPPGNIGDIDEDGMPEVLDGWGRPLGFLRWPVGFELPRGVEPGPDEFDPFRADFGYRDPSFATPFSLRPLIVSAGPDGDFNLRFRKDADEPLGDPSGNYAYRSQTWPGAPYPPPYSFIDPYQRRDGGEIFGSILDTTSEAHADNISNYNLKTSS